MDNVASHTFAMADCTERDHHMEDSWPNLRNDIFLNNQFLEVFRTWSDCAQFLHVYNPRTRALHN